MAQNGTDIGLLINADEFGGLNENIAFAPGSPLISRAFSI